MKFSVYLVFAIITIGFIGCAKAILAGDLSTIFFGIVGSGLIFMVIPWKRR